MPSLPSFIDKSDQLVELVDYLEKFPAIALDAEMDSYYSYYPKLCLIQVSTDEKDFLIDPLASIDLSPLRRLFEPALPLKVLHAADNDIPYFKEYVGGDFQGLFDTHIAAKVLGLAKAGLAGLLDEYFQIQIDKRFQTADWRMRPLPQDMAEYAHSDTRHLLALRRILEPLLVESQQMDLAQFNFRQACQSLPSQRQFNPEAWRKMAGVNQFPPHQKAVLRDLFVWREELAQRLDLALFRVLPDGVLTALSHCHRSTAADLCQHFHQRAVQEHAEDLVRLIREAPSRPLAPPPRRTPEGRLTASQEKLLGHLRNWRNAHPSAPITNRHLKRLVSEAPANWTEFVALNLMPASLLDPLGKELWEEFEQGQSARQSGKR